MADSKVTLTKSQAAEALQKLFLAQTTRAQAFFDNGGNVEYAIKLAKAAAKTAEAIRAIDGFDVPGQT